MEKCYIVGKLNLASLIVVFMDEQFRELKVARISDVFSRHWRSIEIDHDVLCRSEHIGADIVR